MTERVLREYLETLGKFDGGLVRAPREHRVFERIELILQRRVDTRVGVAEQVDPPGADGVEIATAFLIVEPRAGTARDRDERKAFVMFHLGAGVPDGTQAACDPVFGC